MLDSYPPFPGSERELYNVSQTPMVKESRVNFASSIGEPKISKRYRRDSFRIASDRGRKELLGCKTAARERERARRIIRLNFSVNFSSGVFT